MSNYEVKSSAHLVDPEIYEAVAVPAESENYLDTRAGMEQRYSNIAAQMSYDVDVESIWIDNMFEEGRVRLLVVKPKNTSQALHPLFYDIHGGGMYVGLPEMEFETMASLAQNYNFVCVAPDYRLAPEYIQPAQLHDCYSGIKWCIDHAEELRIDVNKIAVAGRSAGGGLAAGLALFIRDRSEFEIHHLRLSLPMLDDRTAAKEPHPYNGQYVWRADSNYFGWKSVLGQEPGLDNISAYYSPARAESLAGLPNTYICVGSIELFADESIEFVKQLMHDGVLVEFHLYPGWTHGAPMVKAAYYPQEEEKNSLHALLRALKLIER